MQFSIEPPIRPGDDHRAIIATWLRAHASQDPHALAWFRGNSHVVERAILGVPVSPEINATYMRQFYGMDVPKVAPILVCAMPKAGSTSISKLLAGTLGRVAVEGHTKNGGQYLGLERDHLRQPISIGAVIHTHLPPTPNVLTLCRVLRIAPIIVLRNVFDALEARARYEKTSTVGQFFDLPTDTDSSIYRFAFEHLAFSNQWLQASRMIGWPVFYFEDNIQDWRGAITRACKAINQELIHLDAALQKYEAGRSSDPATYRISQQAKNPLPDHLIEFIADLAKKFKEPALERLLTRPKRAA